MALVWLEDIRLNVAEGGDPQGAPVVFAHALGTDLRVWDAVLPLLPKGLRLIRLDLRGHGASDTAPAPYAMGALVRDAERVMDHLRLRDAVFVGLSIGGMIAQGLAVKRLDLIRGLALSNTATKIATPEVWQTRIDTVKQGGMAAIADATLDRWFPRRFRDSAEAALWRDRVLRTDPEGWMGCAAAIAGTDFYSTTATLTLPTLCIAGGQDGATPPDLVREMADLIRGSAFHLIRGAGHLPPVDQPQAFATALTDFLRRIAHG